MQIGSGTRVLRVGVMSGKPQKNKRDSLVGDGTPRSPREQVNLPDHILWQHEGKTGGRPPPRPWLRGDQTFTGHFNSFPILPQRTPMPTTTATSPSAEKALPVIAAGAQ